MKKLLAVLLVLVMALGLVACKSDDSGAKKAAEKFAEAFFSGDAEEMVKCFPEYMVDYYFEESGAENEKELISWIEEEYLDGEKTDVKVKDVEIEEDEVTNMDDVFEDYDVSKKEIDKVDDEKILKVTGECDDEEQIIKVLCVKYDGEWCVMDWAN